MLVAIRVVVVRLSLMTINNPADSYHFKLVKAERTYQSTQAMQRPTKRKTTVKVQDKHWPVIVLTLVILIAIFIVFYVLLKNPAH